MFVVCLLFLPCCAALGTTFVFACVRLGACSTRLCRTVESDRRLEHAVTYECMLYYSSYARRWRSPSQNGLRAFATSLLEKVAAWHSARHWRTSAARTCVSKNVLLLCVLVSRATYSSVPEALS